MATYSHIILPTNGPQLWPISTTEPINPPAERRTIGRPKKNRNKANDEPKNPHLLPRDLPTVKCTKCKKMGHNRRTCGGNRALPKGGNKKQKKGKKSDTQGANGASGFGASGFGAQEGDGAATILTQGPQHPPPIQDSRE